MSRFRGIAAVSLLAAGALLVGVAGCGDDGGGASGTIIRGTIDQPVSYDPAGAYDLPSYDVLTNVYQNLLQIPPGGTDPEPEAAESCDFTDNKNTTFECTLKDGLEFSDGSTIDAKDVKFSFDRNIEIASPTGASSLLTNLKSTEAPDEKTVIFQLKESDATFPLLLTAMSFAIVPADGPNAFPADKLEQSDKVVGSGRYTVAAFESGQQTVLEKNDNYKGEDPAKNDRAIVQYFDKASALKLAVEQGDVDIAYRNLSPTDYEDLKQGGDANVIGGKGVEIRYLVFNQDLQPGDSDAQKLAIRRAAAYTIDRDAIANNVYDGTVQPLYSMIPSGLDYAGEPYKAEFGAKPDLDAAKAELQKAGVKTPVPLEIWYTPSHYGPVSADEYAEIKHQLDDSGLFDVTLKSTEWTQYSEAYPTDKYPQFQLGFFPDYPDPDDYAYNLWGSQSFLNDHYSNRKVDKLLAEERATTDTATREKAFAALERLAAADAPTIPYWQGGQTAAVRDNIHGVEETFDPAFLFRFWVISKD
jgi:peptide/nickel transport system substrate-binding protein